MIKVKRLIIGATATLGLFGIGPGMVLAPSALAHPGKPFANLAAYRATGGDCSELFSIAIYFHDAQDNTYNDLQDACFSGATVVWGGPAHEPGVLPQIASR